MKRLLISITILLLFAIPQFALGSDVEDLKATNEKMFKAYNTLDVETIASMVYPGGVLYDYGAAFPDTAPMEDTQAQLAKSLKTILSDLEYISITPYNVQYRVVGNTGIVWGHYTINVKPKGQSMITNHARMTSTWINSNGEWRNIMTHLSAIPVSD